jgi:predicted MFS family arabinose efflux permease
MEKLHFPIRKHYAWVICAGCVLLHFIACGMVLNTISVSAPFIRDKVELSNAQTSTITSIRCLFTMLSMAFAGKYYSRLSLRLGSAIGGLLFVAGALLFSLANSLFVYYLGAALMGMAYGFGSTIPISILIRNWFEDRRSTAISIALCGSSLTNVVAPPAITWLVENYGLHRTFVVEAAFVAVCVVVIFMVLRDVPADLGLVPYREKGYAEKQNQNHQSVDGNFSRQEVLLLFLLIFLIGFSGSSSVSHYSIHFITTGYSATQAAVAVSFYGVIMAAGKLMFGAASDRFGTYRVNYVFLIPWVIGSLITASVNGTSLLVLYFASALNGIGVPGGSIGCSVWVADMSSQRDYARNIQQSQTLFSLGALLGTPVPGIIADLTGSYAFAYILFGAIIALITAVIQRMYRKHIIDGSVTCVACATGAQAK